ncbi:MAG: hypothetical protein K6A74_09270 [Lachnospiraceae bacterium]|nr:hypothetical protein [Lachnospiraceae bacterium]
MSKYRVTRWCSFEHRPDDTYRIYNHIDREEDEADAEDIRRIFLIDNTNDPIQVLIDDGMERDDAECFVDYLLLIDVLRKGRFFTTGPLSESMTVFSFKNVEKYRDIFIGIFALISFAVIPAIYILFDFGRDLLNADLYFESRYSFLGVGIGLALGIVFHEVGHVVAAISYNGWVMEMGITLGIIPGAYTMIDTDSIKSKWGKVAMYLAGIQINLIISALSALATKSFVTLSGFFFTVGLANFELAIVNLLCIDGLDGAGTIKILINHEDEERFSTRLSGVVKNFFRVSQLFYAVLTILNISLILGW